MEVSAPRSRVHSSWPWLPSVILEGRLPRAGPAQGSRARHRSGSSPPASSWERWGDFAQDPTARKQLSHLSASEFSL